MPDTSDILNVRVNHTTALDIYNQRVGKPVSILLVGDGPFEVQWHKSRLMIHESSGWHAAVRLDNGMFFFAAEAEGLIVTHVRVECGRRQPGVTAISGKVGEFSAREDGSLPAGASIHPL